MPMEKVAFEFPDPDRDTSKDIKMKDDGSAEIVIEGRRDPFENVPDKDDKPASKAKAKDDEPESGDIELVSLEDADAEQGRLHVRKALWTLRKQLEGFDAEAPIAPA